MSADYDVLRESVVGYAPVALSEIVEYFASHTTDPAQLRELGQLATDFVLTSPLSARFDVLPAELREAVAASARTLAHHDPDRAAGMIHRSFAQANEFAVRRARVAQVSHEAVRRFRDELRNLERLVQELVVQARDAHDRAEAHRRFVAAATLNEVLADRAIERAAADALFDSGADRRDAPPGAPPAWLVEGAESVTIVVIRPSSGLRLPCLADLPQPSLAALGRLESVVLLPTSLVDDALPGLTKIFRHSMVAVGFSAPIERSASSLAWCRRALKLRERKSSSGVNSVIRCADIPDLLLIGADPELVGLVGDRLLAPIRDQSDYRRDFLLETLAAYVRAPGAGVPTLARHLNRHPQTVRYRLRQLRSIMGDVMHDEQQLLLLRMVFRLEQV